MRPTAIICLALVVAAFGPASVAGNSLITQAGCKCKDLWLVRRYEVLTPCCNYLVHNVGGGDAGDPGGVCCPREADEGVVWPPVCLHF